MTRTISVVTPENITVDYQLAGVATRTMAMLIDLMIQVVLVILLELIVDLVRNVGFGIDHFVSFVGTILAFCIMFVYNIFFEMMWGGRTPGKRLFGLRVIREGGYPITVLSSCIRNIMRFVDLGLFPMPAGNSVVILWGAPGLLSVLFSGRYKRIGDYAAGTLVIHELSATPFDTGADRPILKPEVEQLLPYVKNLDRMTLKDYTAVRRFTARRLKLEPTVQAAVGESIARPLMEKLDMAAAITYQIQYADILEAIERRYVEEYGLL